MEDDLIERIARAICGTTFEGLEGAALDAEVDKCWHVWEDAACAAFGVALDYLNAEPTPEELRISTEAVLKDVLKSTFFGLNTRTYTVP